jgi:hypothetical protein
VAEAERYRPEINELKNVRTKQAYLKITYSVFVHVENDPVILQKVQAENKVRGLFGLFYHPDASSVGGVKLQVSGK